MRQKLIILPYPEASIFRLLMTNKHVLAVISPVLICKATILVDLWYLQYGFTCEVGGI